MRFSWAVCGLGLFACGDDPPREAAKDAASVDATTGEPQCAADCGDGRCAWSSCFETDCVPKPTCRRFVDDCAECGPFYQCWQPSCIENIRACRPSCEYLEPTCRPACGAQYVCSYDGADCDDAGASCTAKTICERGVASCDACRTDERCKEAFTSDGVHLKSCVAN